MFLTVPESTMRRMTDAPKVSPTDQAGLHPSTRAPLSAISRIVHYLLGIVPVDFIDALAVSVALSFPNCLLFQVHFRCHTSKAHGRTTSTGCHGSRSHIAVFDMRRVVAMDRL